MLTIQPFKKPEQLNCTQLNILLHSQVIKEELDRDGYIDMHASPLDSFVNIADCDLTLQKLTQSFFWHNVSLAIVDKWLYSGFDIRPYKDFSLEELEEIYLGLVDNVDVSIYAKRCFTPKQMQQIRWGLRENLDVTPYADAKYTHSQMQELRLGLSDGLDISVYANENYSPVVMAEKRRELFCLKREKNEKIRNNNI